MICLVIVCLSVSLSTCLPVCLSLCLPACLSFSICVPAGVAGVAGLSVLCAGVVKRSKVGGMVAVASLGGCRGTDR